MRASLSQIFTSILCFNNNNNKKNLILNKKKKSNNNNREKYIYKNQQTEHANNAEYQIK